jgi:hypothetical protein
MEARGTVITFGDRAAAGATQAGPFNFSRRVGSDVWEVDRAVATDSTPDVPATDTLIIRLLAEAPGTFGFGQFWTNAAASNVIAVAWQPRAAAAIVAPLYTNGAWTEAPNGSATAFDQTGRRTNTLSDGTVIGTYPAHVQAAAGGAAPPTP